MNQFQLRVTAILTLFFSLFYSSSFAQRNYPEVRMLDSGTKTSLRGLSVVNDNIVWASGSNGMVARSNNGGKNWKWMTVTGFEKTEFRDIEAFDASTAIIMGIGDPAYILKTTDGGNSWKIVYENTTKGMFLDALDFSDPKNGVVIGDPVDGHFFMAKTTDGGDSWQPLDISERPLADSGEAFFAASGTNLARLYFHDLYMVSGGKESRLFINGEAYDLPILKGKETTGANSLTVWDEYTHNTGKHIVVVGGDFNNPDSTNMNCLISHNKGKSWQTPNVPPHGYRSCVEYLSKSNLVTCGLTGVDYSIDGGKNWKWISKTGFHTCQFAKFGTSVFLVGNNGRIAKLYWER